MSFNNFRPNKRKRDGSPAFQTGFNQNAQQSTSDEDQDDEFDEEEFGDSWPEEPQQPVAPPRRRLMLDISAANRLVRHSVTPTAPEATEEAEEDAPEAPDATQRPARRLVLDIGAASRLIRHSVTKVDSVEEEPEEIANGDEEEEEFEAEEEGEENGQEDVEAPQDEPEEEPPRRRLVLNVGAADRLIRHSVRKLNASEPQVGHENDEQEEFDENDEENSDFAASHVAEEADPAHAESDEDQPEKEYPEESSPSNAIPIRTRQTRSTQHQEELSGSFGEITHAATHWIGSTWRRAAEVEEDRHRLKGEILKRYRSKSSINLTTPKLDASASFAKSLGHSNATEMRTSTSSTSTILGRSTQSPPPSSSSLRASNVQTFQFQIPQPDPSTVAPPSKRPRLELPVVIGIPFINFGTTKPS